MVAIKDFGMPSCCEECEYTPKYCSYCLRLHQAIPRDIFNASRHPDCPLVEIGTCKDCKKYRNSLEHCTQWVMTTNDDFYCADFERKK